MPADHKIWAPFWQYLQDYSVRPATVRRREPATRCYHIHAVDSDSLIKLID